MMWRELPPVGEPISLQKSARELPLYDGYKAVWLNSGTAALALAMCMARMRRPDLERPEVIVPAYGCPDLIAAAVYAGVQPVLVDVGAEDPGYDLAMLRSAMNIHTVAVVAVNFLGISERLLELRSILNDWPDAVLVEDDAQWMPAPADHLLGDLVCLSFGRGKPVSLLGGGALLVRDGGALQGMICDEVVTAPPPCRGSVLKWRIRAYNILLRPGLYALVSKNPLIRLGVTAYEPLASISAMSESARRLLPANMRQYLSRVRVVQGQIHEMLDARRNLPQRLAGRSGRLLRYPVLCDSNEERDRLLAAFRKSGLGATSMYQSSLARICGIAPYVRLVGSDVGAGEFARRLLTLPVHSRVSQKDVDRMQDILKCF